jgi:hypothetical protein
VVVITVTAQEYRSMAPLTTTTTKRPTTRLPRRKYPQEHYDTVSTMLISMVPYAEIQKQLSMRWGKPRKYVLDVMRYVHQDWASNAALLADTRRHQIRAGFERVFLLASQRQTGQQSDPDLHVMTRVMRELGLLDGCYVPSEVNVNHTGAVGVGIALGALGFKSPDEVKARIDELRATLAAQGPRALTAPAPDAGLAVSGLAGTVSDMSVIDIDPVAGSGSG